MIRIMNDNLKSMASAGNLTAQKLWVLEEFDELLEAVELFRLGKASKFDVGEEILGCFHICMVFPSTKKLVLARMSDIQYAMRVSAFIFEEQFSYFKDKKNLKSQAIGLTSEILQQHMNSLTRPSEYK